MDESNNPIVVEMQPSHEVSQKRQKTSTKKNVTGNQGSSQVWKHMNRHIVNKVFVGTCDCKYCGTKFTCPSASGTTLL